MADLRRSALLVPVFALGVLAGCPSLTKPQVDEDHAGAVASGSAPGKQVASAAPSGRPSAPPPMPPRPQENGEKVQASHILVSWKGAMRSSQTRTKEEARARINECLEKAKKGEDFAKLAAEYGEDGTKARGGDLGMFGHGQMVPAFDAAAFKLQPGELSGVVETDFGFHLIKRTK
jgi:hypothetical protein